jgi:VWFA-related protein
MIASVLSRSAALFLFLIVVSLFPGGSPPAASVAARTPAPDQQPSKPASRLSICTVVLDSQQQPVAGLRPGDFNVQVNRVPREVVSAEPGAGPLPRSAQSAPVLDWVPRTFLIIIDRDMLENADAQSARALATAIVDGLLPQDEVELVTLPAINRRATPTADRTAVREALARVSGRFQQVWTPGGSEVSEILSGRGSATAAPGLFDIVAREARMRAAELLTAVSGFLDDLRGRRGPVIVVLLSNRIVTDSWNEPEINRTAAVAAAVVAPVYVIPLYGEHWTHQGVGVGGMRTLAKVTGGAVIPAVKNPNAAARQVLQETAGLYVLGVNWLASESAGQPAELSVTLTRPQATLLRAPSRLPIPSGKGTVTSPFLVGARAQWTAPMMKPRDARISRVAPDPRTGSPPEDAGSSVLARAGQFVDHCLRDFPAMAADEQYEQHVRRELPWRDILFRDRVMRSRLLLVRTPSLDEAWVPFRDVFEVDGVAVTDWDHRLEAAFAQAPEAAVKEATAINELGLRFHIGTLSRGTISPMLPLMFLQAEYRGRFKFEPRGQEKVEGLPAQRIDYVEQAQPTLVTASRDTARDVRSQGSFWIEPATGRVLKATIVWDEGLFLKTEIAVSYQSTGLAGFPVLVKETYSTLSASGLLIEATARYSDFRRIPVPGK